MWNEMFQVSTLQALMLGYTRSCITVEELLKKGDIGLGTFENVDGEMIVLDGHCYQAHSDGSVQESKPETGIPFASVCFFHPESEFTCDSIDSIEQLKELLTEHVDQVYGLNSMNIARIDGYFPVVKARSETGMRTTFVELKDILSKTQKSFEFDSVEGTLVCVYYPEYMQGINAKGWHFHFVSKEKDKGGHVFEMSVKNAKIQMDKVSEIDLRLPDTRYFDVFNLAGSNEEDIKKVEQGKG